jgi:hypothetical protein
MAELEGLRRRIRDSWIGEERLQRLDELRLLKLYRRLLAEEPVKADNNGVMYA